MGVKLGLAGTKNWVYPRDRELKKRPLCLHCGLPLPHLRPTKHQMHHDCLYESERSKFLEDWKSGKIEVAKGKGRDRRLGHIARRILLDLANNKCSKCGWNEINPSSGKCPLETDHINGDPYDDRFENFAILCPNCHSLTPNHKGANKGNGRSKQ